MRHFQLQNVSRYQSNTGVGLDLGARAKAAKVQPKKFKPKPSGILVEPKPENV